MKLRNPFYFEACNSTTPGDLLEFNGKIEPIKSTTLLKPRIARWLKVCASLYVGGILSFVGIVLVLAACSEVTVKPNTACRNTDWFEKGRADGLIGLPANEVESHKRLCSGTDHPVDDDLYTNGRNNGLLEYCTAAVGVARGKEALPYLNVCPSYLETSFLNGYKVGGKIRSLEFQNSQVEKRMQALAAKVGKDLSDQIEPPAALAPTIKNRPRSPAGTAIAPSDKSGGDRSSLSPTQFRELEELKRRRSQIDSEIIDLESTEI